MPVIHIHKEFAIVASNWVSIVHNACVNVNAMGVKAKGWDLMPGMIPVRLLIL